MGIDNRREEFLKGLEYNPEKSRKLEMPEEIVNRYEERQQNRLSREVKNQRREYRAKKGTLEETRRKREKGLGRKIVEIVSAFVLAGAFLAAPNLLAKSGSKIIEYKNEKEQEELIELAEQQIETMGLEYEKVEDITQTLQRMKEHYEQGYNENMERITEQNMHEELKNMRELIKRVYKMRIGEACGVDPRDVSQITAQEERILTYDDLHTRVTIPAEISPTGEKIEFMDEEVPEGIKNLIKSADSINTKVDLDYNDPDKVWENAVSVFNGVIEKSEEEYTFNIEGNRLESQKENEQDRDDGDEMEL